MTTNELVLEIINNQIATTVEEEVTPEMRFSSDLQYDHNDIGYLADNLEAEFYIDINSEEVEALLDGLVADAIALVERKLVELA